MRLDLPKHAMLHPLTGAPIHPLGFRKDGRLVWPILGGDPTNDPPADPPNGDPTPAGPPADDRGYPANTPVAEMTPEQQLKYHAFHSRKHENRVKEYGDITPERAKELLAEVEQLRQASLTDNERAVEAAKVEARQAAILETAPRLVAAEFRAAAKGALTAEQTQALIEDLDLSKFLTDDGSVDVAKVEAKVAALAPKQTDPKFPNLGQGRRDGTPAQGVAAGRELYANRRPKSGATS